MQTIDRMIHRGTDVDGDYGDSNNTVRDIFTRKTAKMNTDPTKAVRIDGRNARCAKLTYYCHVGTQLYSHSKILVAAVHGPVFGKLDHIPHGGVISDQLVLRGFRWYVPKT